MHEMSEVTMAMIATAIIVIVKIQVCGSMMLIVLRVILCCFLKQSYGGPKSMANNFHAKTPIVNFFYAIVSNSFTVPVPAGTKREN